MNPNFEQPAIFLELQGFLSTAQLPTAAFGLQIPEFFIDPSVSFPTSMALEIPEKLRLGKRAERLFEYYITHFSEEEILLHNIQIFEDKITIGELDFLLKNKYTTEIYQVELAFKFYLYDPEVELEKNRWIGPNRRDSLMEKITKMKQYQFPLLFHPQTQFMLRKLGIPGDKIQQKIGFKTALFVPRKLLNTKLPYINPACIQGYWMNVLDFKKSDFQNCDFFIPPKRFWGVHPQHNLEWISFSAVKQELLPYLSQEQSPLLWMRNEKQEYERFFVVFW